MDAIRGLPKAVKYGAGIAAVLAGILGGITLPNVSHHSSVGACPARNTCFWQFTNYTGTRYAVQNSIVPNQWLNMPARGSMDEAGNSAIELWDAQTGAHKCILIDRGLSDARMYGHFYINYGAGSCAGIPPFN